MQPLLNIAISAARAAGEVLMRHREQLERLTITQKSERELVSEVDIKAEQVIIQTIQKAYPQHGIIAEESGLCNEDAESVWIIDPLDGTTNYLHSFPAFCVSIAHRVKNKIEHAIIYDPLHQEFFTASRGRGAQLNDRRLRVSKQTQLQKALLGTGLSFRNPSHTKKNLACIASLIGKCAGIRRTGSAALDLAYIAAGRLDGFWEIGLRLWDIAAGCLIIQEAGGLISDTALGSQYLQNGNIIAATPKIFKSLQQFLFPLLND